MQFYKTLHAIHSPSCEIYNRFPSDLPRCQVFQRSRHALQVFASPVDDRPDFGLLQHGVQSFPDRHTLCRVPATTFAESLVIYQPSIISLTDGWQISHSQERQRLSIEYDSWPASPYFPPVPQSLPL